MNIQNIYKKNPSILRIKMRWVEMRHAFVYPLITIGMVTLLSFIPSHQLFVLTKEPALLMFEEVVLLSIKMNDLSYRGLSSKYHTLSLIRPNDKKYQAKYAFYKEQGNSSSSKSSSLPTLKGNRYRVEAALLQKAISIPGSHYQDNLNAYKRLSKLHPDNKHYRSKVSFYKQKVDDLTSFKNAIVDYYNTRGEFRGRFIISKIKKIKVSDVNHMAYVWYVYKPSRRSVTQSTGTDKRTFAYVKRGESIRILSMGGQNSARGHL